MGAACCNLERGPLSSPCPCTIGQLASGAPPSSNASPEQAPIHTQKRGSLVVKDGGFSVAHFVAENRGKIDELYTLDDKVLGEGSYGTVKKCTNTATGVARAVKSIHKHLLKARGLKQLEEEVGIMKVLDHPNILKLYESFEDPRRIYLILELCEGGELFDRIVTSKRFTERTAAIIVREMLLAINYMHQNNIIHRDLKPENFLFATQDEVGTTPLKLIDFGLSKRYSPGTMLSTKAGTPYYVAPEVLSGSYGDKCDIWSIGVIAYICLCGSPPFYGRDTKDVLEAVTTADIHFEKKSWQNVSAQGRQVVLEMLSRDLDVRPSAAEALNTPWLKQDIPDHQLSPIELSNLGKFQHMDQFKKAALNVIASQFTEGDIRDLQAMFKALDVNQDGTICLAELHQGMAKLGVDMHADLVRLFEQCDTDGSGAIDYSEFVASTIDRKRYMQEDACWSAFKVFDLDNNGTIEKSELRQLLGRQNGPATAFHLDEDAIDELIASADTNGDGKVDFDEFMQMMTNAAEHTTIRKGFSRFDEQPDTIGRGISNVALSPSHV
mmetsp:Transcript_3047/g.7287  ORF Transcript_3047/g.7287 Transcript_3047/m.7287 type:complete len:552 (-) Transcript_3047:150-1805(-)